MTPCDIERGVNDPVNFFVTHFQRQSGRDIAPSVNAPLKICLHEAQSGLGSIQFRNWNCSQGWGEYTNPEYEYEYKYFA